VAIDRLDLTISPREVVAIVGQTGCGKSTFFDLAIGLEAPTEGSIRIGDKSPHSDFDFFRGRIATVFQQDRLLPWRSALDNAKLPLELIGLPEAEQRERALTWLKRLGLAQFTNAFPHELSGGMRQRVAIARAFANDPHILLMDEPFSALDAQNKLLLQEELLHIWEEHKKTVVFITHSVDEAVLLGDRVMVMTAQPGRLKQFVPIGLARPRNIMELQGAPEYGELVHRIWASLRDEVQRARELENKIGVKK
jgi:NitT/TauT family transport system ATP-binding protein